MRCGGIGQIGHGGKMPETWDCRKTHRRGRRERREKKETTFQLSCRCFGVCYPAWTWSRLAFQRRSSAQGHETWACLFASLGRALRNKGAKSKARALTHSNDAESQGDDHVLTTQRRQPRRQSPHGAFKLLARSSLVLCPLIRHCLVWLVGYNQTVRCCRFARVWRTWVTRRDTQ